MFLERVSTENPHPIITLEECSERVRTERNSVGKKIKKVKTFKFLRSSAKRLEFWAAARRMIYFRNTPVGMIVRFVDKWGKPIRESKQRAEEPGIGVQYVREVVRRNEQSPETAETVPLSSMVKEASNQTEDRKEESALESGELLGGVRTADDYRARSEAAGKE
jgi:hypothetical protein